MDLIILYRTVILDIIMMLFLLSYGLYCRKYDEHSKKFIEFAVICLAYSVMGLITEITVNSTTLPPKVNDVCHILYFTFGLLFSFNYFKYILEMIMDPEKLKIVLWGAAGLCGISIVIMMFSEIVYVQGAGTKYSQGIGPTLCYALGFLFILISDGIIIANYKNIKNSVIFALLPITLVAIVLLIVQIVYPLFLFSESAIGLVCLGAFFAIEDPVGKFKKNSELYYNYAYIDGLTGLYNRRAYAENLNKYKGPIPKDLICVVMDLNGLKNVNDTVGHEGGDELICEAARLVSETFNEYGKVFRTGGDEFAAIIQASQDEYRAMLAQLEQKCDAWTGTYSNQMKISVGEGTIADTQKHNIMDMVNAADKRMYDVKEEYYRAMGIDRRGQIAAHRALCDLYTKILKINLTKDSYSILDMDADEQSTEVGFSNKISEWLYQFGKSGQVIPEDLDDYLQKTNVEYLKNYFAQDRTSFTISYRRKYDDEYKHVVMEMIPADDYSIENQTLFLFVKPIDK